MLPVTGSWPPEASCTLGSVLLGVEVLITAKSLDAGIYSVSVDKQQENGVLHVGERLVTDGLARRVAVTAMTNGCSGKTKRFHPVYNYRLHYIDTFPLLLIS